MHDLIITTLPITPPRRRPASLFTVRHVSASSETVTKGGARTQGSQTCIENKCKNCCISSYGLASRNGLYRDTCRAHNQPCSLGHRTETDLHLTQDVQEPAATPPATYPSAPQQLSQPAATPATYPVTPQQLPPVSTAHATMMPHAEPSRQLAAAELSLPSFPVGLRARAALSQPLPPAWADFRAQTQSQNVSTKSLKIQQQDMAEHAKRTVALIFYYMEGESPIKHEHHVPTFPSFQISASSQLMQLFEISEASFLDVWQDSGWTTITPSTVLTLHNGKRCLLRLRPSLRQPLRDCPGLDDEIRHQLGFATSKKRPSDTICLPPPKRPYLGPIYTTNATEVALPNQQPLSFSHSAASQVTPSIPNNTGPVRAPFGHQVPVISLTRTSTPAQHTWRRWPSAYFLCEITAGLQLMKNLKLQKKVAEAKAYKTVFPDAENYVHSTVREHRGHPQIHTSLLALGILHTMRSRAPHYVCGFGEAEPYAFGSHPQASRCTCLDLVRPALCHRRLHHRCLRSPMVASS
ncbi:hypothetical protein HGRIS_013650 [Hohenbuehelia grisea]|uniref:Uncharacterized protein n=1 Tax=Hohenbuehelia grisea TaxID=104357 RepID=A0ABR3IW82_9AGAR